ncbi:DUF262 domain-containing protein [Marinomonas posidonica]|uniref:GmrSD restriction endonucleases N-terminal domain-containing protein n=1 Tax=Marinomonas posidonica (strain CECT 7376 / NCIMB 14433 / IVIA-Po-181) TaxID=491952 RepID=F6CWG6_MARPP|nr:DUF262 domain-containing protein [Marinomonas posidonica]AEF53221.1 protein of unknown function DUF262 [Marinomonas posidonica IVIA-Po-181]
MSSLHNSEPRVVFMTHLLKQLNLGEIKIPRFQREFVWDWEQQHDLLCSILEGLPIGAILLWETRKSNMKYIENIGPFELKKSNSEHNIFLMDGLQRLTTLFLSIYHPTDQIKNHVESNNYDIYCDLNSSDINNTFFQKKTIQKIHSDQYISPRYMPLSAIMDTKKLLKYQRTIPIEKSKWLDRSDDIVSAFISYKLPVVPLETNDQDIVTKSFERINTRGTQMSETHMLNALSYSTDFDLLKVIEGAKENYLINNNDWYDIDNSYLILLIKVFVGFDIYSKRTEELVKKINEDLIVDIFKSLKKLAIFSNENFCINSPNDFPYKLQLITLAQAFRANMKKIDDETLKAWFTFTTYTGAFGTTARNSSNAINDFQILLKTGTLNWTLNSSINVEKWTKNINYKTARVKAWSLSLSIRLDELKGNSENQISLIESRGKILRKIKHPTIETKKIHRSGLYFISRNNKAIDINNISENELESNFLDDELINIFNDGKIDLFCDIREEKIYQWEIENLVKPASELLNIKYDTKNK